MTLVKFNKQNTKPFFSDVFDTVFSDPFLSDKLTTKMPAVNIAETENDYQIELAAPGLKKEDFKIHLDKNILTVSSESKEEDIQENKQYNKREYSYTSFARSFTLPDSADQLSINATYTDGVLKIAVAKKEEAKIQSREIAIK